MNENGCFSDSRRRERQRVRQTDVTKSYECRLRVEPCRLLSTPRRSVYGATRPLAAAWVKDGSPPRPGIRPRRPERRVASRLRSFVPPQTGGRARPGAAVPQPHSITSSARARLDITARSHGSGKRQCAHVEIVSRQIVWMPFTTPKEGNVATHAVTAPYQCPDKISPTAN
jgi:hypothetical protein